MTSITSNAAARPRRKGAGPIFEGFRSRHGMSQAQLASALKVAQGAIGNYEAGLRQPSIDIAWRFKRYAESKGELIHLEEIYPEPSRVAQ
ncbi:MAG: helix-turn-helix transcriptional regulator [Methylococcaceae bacterium]